MGTIEEIKAFSTILIVDDCEENIFSLTKILEAHNYLIEYANSGEEALKKTLKGKYSLILLDVQMPGINGYEVAEALKGANKTKHIPLIFLTATSKERKLVQYSSTGPVDYVEKPFEIDLLIIKINNFLRFNHQLKELEELYTQIALLKPVSKVVKQG